MKKDEGLEKQTFERYRRKTDRKMIFMINNKSSIAIF